MSRFLGRLLRLIGDQSGASAVEYALLAALVCLISVAGMLFLGDSVSDLFNATGAQVQAVNDDMASSQ